MEVLDPRRYTPIHRIIEIEAAPGNVRAQIADNVHQFCVDIRHEEGHVVSIEGGASRVPWTTCPAALARLQDLVDAPLTTALPPVIDKARQCTHIFDLAKLAMAHALHTGQRRYDVFVGLSLARSAVDGLVWLNGAELLRWRVEDYRVVSAGPFYGHTTTGPATWPGEVNDPDIRQAVLLLRRALLVFFGSGRSRGTTRAEELPYMAGACHTFQSSQISSAERPTAFRHYPAEAVEKLAADH